MEGSVLAKKETRPGSPRSLMRHKQAYFLFPGALCGYKSIRTYRCHIFVSACVCYNASGVQSMRMHVAAVFATQTHIHLYRLTSHQLLQSLPWVPIIVACLLGTLRCHMAFLLSMGYLAVRAASGLLVQILFLCTSYLVPVSHNPDWPWSCSGCSGRCRVKPGNGCRCCSWIGSPLRQPICTPMHILCTRLRTIYRC